MERLDISKIQYWYHGTTLERADHIVQTGFTMGYNHIIKPNYNEFSPAYATTDFGPGLYLTPYEATAQKWANVVSYRTQPAVIKVNLGAYLANCDLKTFNKADKSFANCVKYCRLSGYENPKYLKYDGIYGPIADGNIASYVMAVRTQYLAQKVAPVDIPNQVSTQEFQNHFKMNRQSDKMVQLCITKPALIDKYVNQNIIKVIH